MVFDVAGTAVASMPSRAVGASAILAEVKPHVFAADVRGGLFIPVDRHHFDLHAVPVVADLAPAFVYVCSSSSADRVPEVNLVIQVTTVVTWV